MAVSVLFAILYITYISGGTGTGTGSTCRVCTASEYTCTCDSYAAPGTITCTLLTNATFTAMIEDLTRCDVTALTNLTITNSNIPAVGGTSAPNFTDFSALEYLQMTGCGLQGVYLGSFSQLTNLREVNMSNNQIAHLNQDAFLSATSMQIIDFSYNALKSLDLQLHDLTALTDLNFSYNSMIYFTPSFYNNFALEFMDFSYNRLGPNLTFSFSPLTGLKFINLAKNKLSYLPGDVFSGNTQLGTVDVSGNRISNEMNVSWLINTPGLMEFNAENNRDLSLLTVDTTPSLPVLQNLSLGDDPLQCVCAEAWLVSLAREVEARGGTAEGWCAGPDINTALSLTSPALTPCFIDTPQVMVLPFTNNCSHVYTSSSSVCTVPVGSELTLNCYASGSPDPNVWWLGPDGTIMYHSEASTNPKDYSTLAKLGLTDTVVGDTGLYTCYSNSTAVNGSGNATIQLVVAPTLETTPVSAFGPMVSNGDNLTTKQLSTAADTITTRHPSTAADTMTTEQPSTAADTMTTEQPSTAADTITTEQPSTAADTLTTEQPSTAADTMTTEQPSTAADTMTTEQPSTAAVTMTTKQPSTAVDTLTTEQPSTVADAMTTKKTVTTRNNLNIEQSAVRNPLTTEQRVTNNVPFTSKSTEGSATLSYANNNVNNANTPTAENKSIGPALLAFILLYLSLLLAILIVAVVMCNKIKKVDKVFPVEAGGDTHAQSGTGKVHDTGSNAETEVAYTYQTKSAPGTRSGSDQDNLSGVSAWNEGEEKGRSDSSDGMVPVNEPDQMSSIDVGNIHRKQPRVGAIYMTNSNQRIYWVKGNSKGHKSSKRTSTQGQLKEENSFAERFLNLA